MGRLNVGGGINTSDATATANDIKVGKTAYVNKEKIIGTSSAVDINGIIKEYEIAAGKNISAGDFVEYINKEMGTANTSLGGNYSGYAIQAIAISNNRVFVGHEGGTNGNYFYATILQINDDLTITVAKAATTISSYSTGVGQAKSMTLIGENKIFIAYSDTSTDSSYTCALNACICTINDNSTISVRIS